MDLPAPPNKLADVFDLVPGGWRIETVRPGAWLASRRDGLRLLVERGHGARSGRMAARIAWPDRFGAAATADDWYAVVGDADPGAVGFGVDQPAANVARRLSRNLLAPFEDAWRLIAERLAAESARAEELNALLDHISGVLGRGPAPGGPAPGDGVRLTLPRRAPCRGRITVGRDMAIGIHLEDVPPALARGVLDVLAAHFAEPPGDGPAPPARTGGADQAAFHAHIASGTRPRPEPRAAPALTNADIETLSLLAEPHDAETLAKALGITRSAASVRLRRLFDAGRAAREGWPRRYRRTGD